MNRLRYLLGLITLAAVAAGGVFLYGLLTGTDVQTRFRLDLEFRDVRGLKPGADVRYRGVLVGTVHEIRLRDDGARGVVTITLDPTAQDFARYNSRFWVVTPRFQGLTGGASGLDTLVRDAYVAFATHQPAGPPLPAGSLVAGSEEPEADPDNLLPAVQRGDLVMTLLVPENYGLGPGSRVMFRGVRTGEVRTVALAGGGTHVELVLRVDREHRRTITDTTKFWVARPRLSGALLSGISIDDLSALLSPFVGYYTDASGGPPVADGYRAAATVERPEFSLSAVQVGEPHERSVRELPPAEAEQIQVVHISYAAREVDWLSPDDDLRREGSGVLLEDATGGLVVLTCRSVCDGIWFASDGWFSKPKVRDEKIRVLLPDGTVLRAGRSWVDGDVDLALLKLEDAPPGTASTPPRLLQLAPADGLGGGAKPTGSSAPAGGDAAGDAGGDPAKGAAAGGEVQGGNAGAGETAPPASNGASAASAAEPILQQRKADGSVATHALEHAAAVPLAEWRGAAVITGGKLTGVLGQRGRDDDVAEVVPLSRLPESLRPRQ